jgi:hypothetical protein
MGHTFGRPAELRESFGETLADPGDQFLTAKSFCRRENFASQILGPQPVLPA